VLCAEALFAPVLMSSPVNDTEHISRWA